MALDERRPDLGADLGQAGERSGATNNGLPLIRPAARGTTSNTRRSTSQTVMADCSTVRPTPESRGSRRSTFPTSLYFERSTWTATAISTWAAKDSDFRCARSSNAQFANQTPVFDQVTPVDMGGDLVGGGINPGGLDRQAFLAVDHSGTATNDYIYMLASVQP